MQAIPAFMNAFWGSSSGFADARFAVVRDTGIALPVWFQALVSGLPRAQWPAASRDFLRSSLTGAPIEEGGAETDTLTPYETFTRTVGAGVRFANDKQPFGELGLGMNHYVWGRRLALVPSIRWRFYSEQRTQSVFVAEGLMQLGVSWLF